jgi:HSP20 family molecular chaperone IbpA
MVPFGGFSGANNWMAPFGGFENTPFGSFDRFGSSMTPYTGSFDRSIAPFAGAFDRFGSSMFPFDRVGRHMERDMHHMMHDFEKTFSSELNLLPSRPASMLESYSLANPIRCDAEGNRWLSCNFELRSYKPDEIKVTLDAKNRFLNVEAQHEVKDKEHYVKRSYSRKVFIPEDVKVDLAKLDVKSCLSKEGVLSVEAALPKLSLEEARASLTTKTVSPATIGGQTVYNVATKTI